MTKHHLSRRDFLGTLSASLMLPSLGLSACSHLVRTKPSIPDCGLLLMPMEKKLVVFNTRTAKALEIPVPNKVPHSTIVMPGDPRRVLVVDQTTRDATLVDILDQKILAQYSPEPGFMLSGHGCVSSDGREIFLAEFPGDLTLQGRLSVLDARSLACTRRLPTYARWSHNVAFLKQDTVLAVGHRGSELAEGKPSAGGCLTFLDRNSGKLLEMVKPNDTHLFLNHFAFTASDELFISTQSYYAKKSELPPFAETEVDLETPLMVGKFGSKTWAYLQPEKLRPKMKHNHTIVVDKPRNRALVAHAGGGLVSLWNLQSRSILATYELADPLGIAISSDGSHYVLGSKSNTHLFVQADSLLVGASLSGERLGVSGNGPLHLEIIPHFS